MTPENFVYWIQGLFELADPKSLDENQTAMIKRHINLVFKNVTAEPDTSPDKATEIEKLLLESRPSPGSGRGGTAGGSGGQGGDYQIYCTATTDEIFTSNPPQRRAQGGNGGGGMTRIC